MKKISVAAALSLLMVPGCFATVSNNIGIYNAGTTLPTAIGGGAFNMMGDVVSPTITPSGVFTFPVSGSEVTSGSELTDAATGFSDLVSVLDALTYTPATLTSGVVNNLAPGNYSFAGNVNLGPGTVINFQTDGQYVLNFAGSLFLSGVTVTASVPTLSSESVYWYASTSAGQVSVTNSNFFGSIVGVANASQQVVANDGATYNYTGQFLSGGAGFSSFTVTNGSSYNFKSTGLSDVPEPSTFALLGGGLLLAGGLKFRNRAR